MLVQHHAAARARLEAHPGLADKVDDSVRIVKGAEVQTNYVILTVTLPGFDEGRLAGIHTPSGDQLLDVTVRAVATTYGGLLLLMDAVSEQYLGHRLVVPGRALTPLARTMLFDPDFNRASSLHFMDAEFEATSSRV